MCLMVADHPLFSVSDPLPQPVGNRLGSWPLADENVCFRSVSAIRIMCEMQHQPAFLFLRTKIDQSCRETRFIGGEGRAKRGFTTQCSPPFTVWLASVHGESLDLALACGIHLTEPERMLDLRSTGGSLNEREWDSRSRGLE